MEKTNVSFKINGRWDGDRNGTGRMVTNGVEVPVSAPAQFAGPGVGSNPEELLISSVATCYIITLAAILSKRNIEYSHLDIESEGIVEKEGNTMQFKEIIHRPVVILTGEHDEEKRQSIEQYTQRAEKACFIGQTLKPNIAFSVQPDVRFA